MPERGRYMISVAADLAGLHPQTLRMYEARGLITPKRSPKQTRLYSQRDVERLRRRLHAAAEQMTSAKQAPWTDIYGLSATLYHAITGHPPPSAFDRVLATRFGVAAIEAVHDGAFGHSFKEWRQGF